MNPPRYLPPLHSGFHALVKRARETLYSLELLNIGAAMPVCADHEGAAACRPSQQVWWLVRRADSSVCTVSVVVSTSASVLLFKADIVDVKKLTLRAERSRQSRSAPMAVGDSCEAVLSER